MKLYKMPYIIYADLKSLIKNIDGCANNLKEMNMFLADIHYQIYGLLIV